MHIEVNKLIELEGILCIMKKLGTYLSALDFLQFFSLKYRNDELDFFPSLNWIFLPDVVCKIQL